MIGGSLRVRVEEEADILIVATSGSYSESHASMIGGDDFSVGVIEEHVEKFMVAIEG